MNVDCCSAGTLVPGYLLLPIINCTTHSTCGVLYAPCLFGGMCAATSILAVVSVILQNLEVKVKICGGGGEVARATHHYDILIFV